MLSILLTILKIIGLILLSIIGLVLLILLAVLLVPIRYEANAAMAENKPTVKARISWLLRFLNVRVSYMEDGLHYLVKILGFRILDSDKPEPKKTEKQNPNKTKPKKQKIQKQKQKKSKAKEEEASLHAEPEISVEEPAENEVKVSSVSSLKTDTKPAAEEKKSEEEIKPEEEKKSFQEKLEDLKTKKDEIIAKVQGIKAKIDEVLTYLQSQKGRKLLAFLRKKLFRLLRHLKPKALHINGRIGLSDPATTGIILGISYMLYPLYEDHIHIMGEFEEEIIEGDVYIKGRIRLGTLLFIVIQIILNKEVRMWIKKLTGGNRK